MSARKSSKSAKTSPRPAKTHLKEPIDGSLKVEPLTSEILDYSVSFKPNGVASSADVEPLGDIIGQDRAISAIRLGLQVPATGYNIFVTGLPGTGRSVTISQLLKQLDLDKPELIDICYVNNFKQPDEPRVLTFKAGDGRRFKKDMQYLIDSLRKVVPKVFLSEDYKDRRSRITREFENRQRKLIQGFEQQLSDSGFVMVQLQSGMGPRNEIQPLVEGEPVGLEKLELLAGEQRFSESQLDELRRKWDLLRREFDVTTVESKKLSSKEEEALEKLNQSLIAPLVSDKVDLLRRRYPDAKCQLFFHEVEDELSTNLDRYRESPSRRGEDESPTTRRSQPFEEFQVNLLLDNAETSSVPIMIEKSPSYKNLFGSLERVVDKHGIWKTDFTRIHAGSLVKAAGGFLVMNAIDLLTEPGSWTHLKRFLRSGELEITAYDPFYLMAGSGIKPQPIPISVKVLVIGEPYLYRLLWNHDEEFKTVFKIKAEFDTEMPLSDDCASHYYRFIRKTIDDDKLQHFSLTAMQTVVAYGRRIAGNRDKLSLRFTAIADLVRESAYFATQAKRKQVAPEDVRSAIAQMRQRVNLIEDKIQEMYDREILLIKTTGDAVGQINALSVYQLGDYTFGRPSRITATTSLGKSGIVNIEREVNLSGPIHSKGVLILTGFLRQLFAQDKPLVLSASISFEQSYGGVDGDSASSTEIYVLLSSITGVPIRQDLAVTGSVDQYGNVQPVGGVTEKIEGWFEVCKARGLSGTQGVLIPVQNVTDVLLRPDILEAVREKKFSIYPITKVTEGIQLLMGKPAGERDRSGKFPADSLYGLADKKLHDMALDVDRFGHPRKQTEPSRPLKKTSKKRVVRRKTVKR